MHRKLISIRAMDVVGYSRLMERDEAGTLAHLFRDEYREAANWARRSVRIPNAQY